MLPEASLDDARAFAERLREAVASATFVLGGEPQRLTISIGIARLAPGRGDRSALMKAADAALYRAKASGRNRIAAASTEDATLERPAEGEALVEPGGTP